MRYTLESQTKGKTQGQADFTGNRIFAVWKLDNRSHLQLSLFRTLKVRFTWHPSFWPCTTKHKY
jgi:hypothetical protein